MNIQEARRLNRLTTSTLGTGAVEVRLDALMAEYRTLLTSLFADHRHPHGVPGIHGRCSCGSPWPCPKEERAAQLLDEWVQ